MQGVGRPRLYPDMQTKWRENQRRYRKAKQQHLKVYHRSLKSEWETPQIFFDQLHAEFSFTLDVCATQENAKCPRFFTQHDDGLTQPWGQDICWMNPPYGKGLERWVAKAYESAQAGATVVCLLPARTDSRWWHNFVPRASARRFVEKRLHFSNAKNSATFPSVVVIFRPHGAVV